MPWEGPIGPQKAPRGLIWSQLPLVGATMCSGPFRDLYDTPGALLGALEVLGGPYGASLVPTSVDWSDRVVIVVTTHFGLLSGLAWAP